MTVRSSLISGIALALGACRGAVSPSPPVESSVIAAGQAVSAANAPVNQAIVHVQALSFGMPGGEFGCTGAYLTGDWYFITGTDGRFAVDVRGTTRQARVCIIVLGMPPGDTAWGDTVGVVATLKPVGVPNAPDTLRFDLRFSR